MVVRKTNFIPSFFCQTYCWSLHKLYWPMMGAFGSWATRLFISYAYLYAYCLIRRCLISINNFNIETTKQHTIKRVFAGKLLWTTIYNVYFNKFKNHILFKRHSRFQNAHDSSLVKFGSSNDTDFLFLECNCYDDLLISSYKSWPKAKRLHIQKPLLEIILNICKKVA